MNLPDEKHAGHFRAAARLNSRILLALEWSDAGRSLRVEGYTLDISPEGCLAIVPQGFVVGQKLKLTNLSNQKEAQALLVWRGHEGHGGWELGLKLENLPVDFWGVDHQ